MSQSSPMAFVHHHHLPSLILLMIPFYISINGNSLNPSSPNPPSFHCGDDLIFWYPFWQRDKHLDCHGYPEFGISCIDHSPIFHLSKNLYVVKNINYSENTLTLAYHEASSNKICPMPSQGVTFNTTSSFLNYTIDNKMLYFVYNCTLYPPSIEHVKCVQYGAKHTYIFLESATPEFDWPGHCEAMVKIPVMEKALENVTDLAVEFGNVMQEGFKLKWHSVDYDCQICEASGGFCGYYSNYTSSESNNHDQKFVCYCSDGHPSSNCHDKGVVSNKSKPNFVVIGAMVLGGSLIALTIFYFIHKKTSLQKRGFSQIPNINK